MIDSVVDLVEEHVDLGGPRFSGSFLGRWRFARASRRSVVVQEFWSPCLPRFFRELLIVGVERLDLMIYFKVVLYCNVVFIKLP